MYRVRWPSNNCHQIPSKCTKSHTCIEFQKLSGWIPPDSRRLGALSPDTRPRLGKWQGGNPSNWIGLEYSLTPHSTQYRSFQRRSSQPMIWLILTNKTVEENTDKQTPYKSEKVNNLKYGHRSMPRVEPGIVRSQVQHPNHYTTRAHLTICQFPGQNLPGK